MNKTVLELDLVGYSSVARLLEESTNSKAVAALNKQVLGFVDQGLDHVGLSPEKTVMVTTGDGAILVFDKASDAHHLAESVHKATGQHNAVKSEPSAKRWFRVGAATGNITMKRQPIGGYEIAGVTIANAVRLEAASNPGELLIDTNTYDALPPTLRLRYGKEEEVPGKREETFRVRRCVMAPEAEQASSSVLPARPKKAQGNRRAILELLEQLYPRDLLEKLMFLLMVPPKHRPAQTLTHAERCLDVLTWSESQAGPGLPQLESELRYLIEKEERP